MAYVVTNSKLRNCCHIFIFDFGGYSLKPANRVNYFETCRHALAGGFAVRNSFPTHARAGCRFAPSEVLSPYSNSSTSKFFIASIKSITIRLANSNLSFPWLTFAALI